MIGKTTFPNKTPVTETVRLTIDDVLVGAGFTGWSNTEQIALTSMMRATATKQSIESIASSSKRVHETFIKILDLHLPPNTED